LLYNKADGTEAMKRLEAGFPDEKDIRRVYQALSNYFQVPAGANVDRSFDFDIIDFCRRFDIETGVAYPALKILEQCDLIALTENFYEPSKLKFELGQHLLYKFQVEHPQQDDFIKLLLRSYGGMFDQYVTINEQLLARREKQDEGLIRKQLVRLHQLGVVDYQPQKSTPQLTFLQTRADAKLIDLKKALLKQRKETAEEKLKAMLAYADNTVECRSKKLVEYFNEHGSEDCGICDVCLQRKKLELSTQEFEQLMQQIRDILSATPLMLPVLLKQLPSFTEEKITDTVRYLLDNDKLRYNSSQELEWNK
jgi:ATP-dependent DNA helicase RecQ